MGEGKETASSPTKSSRPATQLTPTKPNKKGLKSPSPRKAAWIVADWKHRVPEQQVHSPKKSPGSFNGSQVALRVKQRRQQLSAEYHQLDDTIQRILDRCRLVQQRLGSSPAGTAASSHHQQWAHAPHLSMRSQLLFEAPEHPESVNGLPVDNTQHELLSAADSAAGKTANGNPTNTASGKQQSQQQGLQGHSQQHPNSHNQTAHWAKAVVDLNPGFSFQPGTPQHAAACGPDQLQQMVARMQDLFSDVKQADSGCLQHREILQAGLQQLTGEFYAEVRAAQLQRQGQQRKDTVISASWA